MSDNMLTQKMKRDAVIVAIRAGKKESEITTFLNVARSFLYKVRKELVASVDEISTVSERKKHSKQNIIDNDGVKSMRSIAKELQVSDWMIRKVVHEDLRYKSYVLRRGQFLSEKTEKNGLIRCKLLLTRVKKPEEPQML